MQGLSRPGIRHLHQGLTLKLISNDASEIDADNAPYRHFDASRFVELLMRRMIVHHCNSYAGDRTWSDILVRQKLLSHQTREPVDVYRRLPSSPGMAPR